MSYSISSSFAIFTSPSNSMESAGGGKISLEVTILILCGAFVISILMLLICLYFVTLCYKARGHKKRARSSGTERDDQFTTWDRNISEDQLQRHLSENSNVQNSTFTGNATSQQWQQPITQPEVNPYDDSDSYIDSFSDEESTDGPKCQGRSKHTRMKGRKKIAKTGQQKALETATQNSEGLQTNEAEPTTVLHENLPTEKAEIAVHEPANVPCAGKELQAETEQSTVEYQNWPAREGVVEGLSNSSDSVELTHHLTPQFDGNADLDRDEELRKSMENLSRSIEDLEKEVV